MATIQEVSPAPWRLRLVPASFAGVQYHVEQQSRSSGRRVVVHEYPKKNTGYSEDMGRHVRRYQVTGYLIGPDYGTDKRALIDALEDSEGGALIDPYLAEEMLCICERYSVTEVRERGGYCAFEMLFVEMGQPGNAQPQTDTGGAMLSKANSTGTATASLLDRMPTSV